MHSGWLTLLVRGVLTDRRLTSLVESGPKKFANLQERLPQTENASTDVATSNNDPNTTTRYPRASSLSPSGG